MDIRIRFHVVIVLFAICGACAASEVAPATRPISTIVKVRNVSSWTSNSLSVFELHRYAAEERRVVYVAFRGSATPGSKTSMENGCVRLAAGETAMDITLIPCGKLSSEPIPPVSASARVVPQLPPAVRDGIGVAPAQEGQ